ncbi:MAG: AmmeMemoRadiSam system radical SAM enzyme [Bacteroidota bacterium]|nr:AmmeMemoRadiSam system radical SAM enzyme [Bacteroidota bacterium]
MENEALLYQKLDNKKVQCNLCAHRCKIGPGKKGICIIRENKDGILYTKVYGRTITQHADPIEKKPLYHFYPGSEAFSIATPGCNFRCRFCQNWDISQVISDEILELGQEATPEQIVDNARRRDCKIIAYTYTEPTIFFEYSYDTAIRAHEAGMKNIYVSNGYMTYEMLDMIGPYLDGINVDLKAFRDETYRSIAGAHLQPVLDNLKKIKQMGIWLEVTSLIIPGINDDPEEIKDMANFVANELGFDVPWHISRFMPAYKMKDVAITPAHTLQMAKEIGFEAGLHYVYPGNIRTSGDSNTVCPECGYTLIKRSYFETTHNHIVNGKCPECGATIAGMGL